MNVRGLLFLLKVRALVPHLLLIVHKNWASALMNMRQGKQNLSRNIDFNWNRLLKDKLRMIFDSAASPVQPRPNSYDSLLRGVTAGTFRWNNSRPHAHVFFVSAHASISTPGLLGTFRLTSCTNIVCLLATAFSLVFCSAFSRWRWGDMFFRNVRWLSTGYKALYPLHNHRCENLKSYAVCLHSTSPLLFWIWGFNGGEGSYCGLLSYNTV
jgi:hypothetical protein